MSRGLFRPQTLRKQGQSDLFAGTAYSGPGVVCGECGRPLTNAASVAAGIGPVCAGGKHAQAQAAKEKGDMDEIREMERASYTARIEDGAIVLEDSGKGYSITNAAASVIRDLGKLGYNLRLPVIYRDTDGRWDGLAVRNGEFVAFYPLNKAEERDYAEARARLVVMQALRDPRLADATPTGPVSGEVDSSKVIHTLETSGESYTRAGRALAAKPARKDRKGRR